MDIVMGIGLASLLSVIGLKRNTATESRDLIIRHVQNYFKTSLYMIIL